MYLLTEHPGLRPAAAGPTADLVVEELLEQPHLAANPSSGQADPGHPQPLPQEADAMVLEYSSVRAPGAAGAERRPARRPCKVSSYRPGPSK